ncbi:hypothetical protein KOW79_009532 [Hemibagrus wyckioides]|uniref:Uncharacterized protein n=1 Tax=Hemibagrus wyckioides TaxID=337641 RepID=A0A9D3NP78_9TELE|nr:hypothetical protein KOW79_009532 [Hemibagrus wyckioides]
MVTARSQGRALRRIVDVVTFPVFEERGDSDNSVESCCLNPEQDYEKIPEDTCSGVMSYRRDGSDLEKVSLLLLEFFNQHTDADVLQQQKVKVQ